MSDHQLSPDQLEFRDRLTALLVEFSKAAGPEFDGGEEGVPMEMPRPVAWVLTSMWEDMAADEAATVLIDSGCRRSTRLGLLLEGLDMVRAS